MSADIECHAFQPIPDRDRCAECYCPATHSIHTHSIHTPQPVDADLFKRTAPKWNCVDFPDGMHYVPGETCLWCGKSSAEIRAQATS